MPFDAGTVEGKLSLDVKQFTAAIDRANAALDRIENHAKKAAKEAGGFRKALAVARDIVIVFPAALKALTAPLRALSGFFSKASSAAAEFQDNTSKLQTSLSLQGISRPGALTTEIEKYAAALQDVTAFSDSTTISVAQTLAIMGVQEDKLKLATKAVLDYSAATGRNAVESARQFAKTLGGTLGELAEAFPALKALSKEALMAGEAFDFADKVMGGFAESVANTTKGLRARFKNAFDDLLKAVGSIINPVLDVITRLGTDIVKTLTGKLREADFRAVLVDKFRDLVRLGIAGARGFIDSILNVPALVAKVGVAISKVVGAVRVGLKQFKVSWFETAAEIQQSLLGLLEQMGPALSKLLGIDAEGMIAGIKTNLDAAEKALAGANIELAGAKASAQNITEFAEDNVKAWQEWADEVREGNSVVGGIYEALDKADEALRNMDTSADGLKANVKEIEKTGRSQAEVLHAQLTYYRNFTGLSAEVKRETKGVAEATKEATGQAGELVNEWGRVIGQIQQAGAAVGAVAVNSVQARSAARDASDPFSQSLSGQGDAFGRHKGGSAGFDTSSVAGLQQAISASLAAGRASVGGLYSHAARKSAGIVTKQLQTKLNALLDRQFADFTSSIVEELNRAGIFDPTARQRMIDARISEARRLGILPKSGSGARIA